ncbi:MAG: PH domain-containing protein [Acidobacteriota bacterium]
MSDLSAGEPQSGDRRLDPRFVPYSRLGSLIGMLILAAFSVPPTIGFWVAWPARMGWIALAWFGLLGLLLLRAWIWAGVRYRHIFWRLDDNGLRIRRGVWWRSVTSVPRSRVQHTDVSQGPIERRFGLATLTVYTAGTQHASVPLAGLEHEQALAVRDVLLEGDDDDAV